MVRVHQKTVGINELSIVPVKSKITSWNGIEYMTFQGYILYKKKLCYLFMLYNV